MCGRYDLSQNPAAIRAKFAVPEVPAFAPNADVRPTESAPIVRLGREGARECVLARWGLVPAWAKDLKFGARCFNARSETVATQAAFRSAFHRRRCLVPVEAFFEWSGERGHKRKWRIEFDEAPPFALAGLWELWRDPVTNEAVETFSVITTAANAALAALHARMPVIVAAPDYSPWLGDEALAASLLRPVPPPALRVEAAA